MCMKITRIIHPIINSWHYDWLHFYVTYWTGEGVKTKCPTEYIGNVYNILSLLLLMTPLTTYANQYANHIWK